MQTSNRKIKMNSNDDGDDDDGDRSKPIANRATTQHRQCNEPENQSQLEGASFGGADC